MKWVTGQVRCQVTGRNPTRNGAVPAGPCLDRPLSKPWFSTPWSRLMATSQVAEARITVRLMDMVAPFLPLEITAAGDSLLDRQRSLAEGEEHMQCEVDREHAKCGQDQRPADDVLVEAGPGVLCQAEDRHEAQERPARDES